MLFELQDSPPIEMLAVCVSATQKHCVVVLPEWNESIAFYLTTADPNFPTQPRPAVNVHYTCKVDLNGAYPKILSWKPSKDPKPKHVPNTLPAPHNLPTPPDLLPVLDEPALTRTLDKHLGKLKKPQRETVAYLVRRAYGQGKAEGMRRA